MTATAGRDDDRTVAERRPIRERLLEAWRSRRDKLLTNKAFLDWSLRFPLTRPVARARTRELFDLCAGFVYSQVLFACVQLRLFDHLAAGPDSLEGLSRRLHLSSDASRRLVDAAVALRLVERRGTLFGLGPLGAAAFAAPGVAEMIEHHHLLYADLADPVALLRGQIPATHLGGYWPYAAARPAPQSVDAIDRYTDLMAASQAMVAAEVIAAVPLAGHRCLLDIGGGDGSFIAAVAKAAPSLRMMLFDLPPVAARAAERFESDGLSDRARAFGGDFRVDGLPAGADIVTLVRILHDHDDETVRSLLAAVRHTLPPGGSVVVAEPMLDVGGAETAGAYFAFYLLAMGRGRPRTPAEITAFLAEAGFSQARRLPTRSPIVTSIVHAM